MFESRSLVLGAFSVRARAGIGPFVNGNRRSIVREKGELKPWNSELLGKV